MTLQWLLIDFDNTLMDTETHSLPVLIARFNELYGHTITQPLTLELFLQQFHGLSGDTLCQCMSDYFQRPIEHAALFQDRERLMQRHYQSLALGVKMAPGVIEILSHYKAQGTILALVTNNPLQRAFAAMRYAGNKQGAQSARLFDENFFEANPIQKPAPDVYLRALSQLKADPKRSIAIEDSPTGVRSATGAGLLTLGYLGLSPEPATAQQRLIDNGCQRTFHHWSELPQYCQ